MVTKMVLIRRNSMKIAGIAAAVLVVTGASSGLFAQDGQDATTTVTSGEDVVNEISIPGRTAHLTPEQKREQANKNVGEMKATLERVLQLQQAARAQSDVIKLNCVNDRLVQVKKLLNIAESSSNDLTEATSSKNVAEQSHQMERVAIAYENSITLRDEAEACIGDELIFVGPTQVEVDGPNLGDDLPNPYDNGLNEPLIERPAYASPFL